MDPIRTATMNNRFTAIVEEASATLYRTAFTTYVKLAQDFQCAMATPEGELFSHPEQAGVNIFIGLPLHSTLDFIGRETMEPGDVYITNDPFTTNGMVTHMMDVTMLRPIFYEEKADRGRLDLHSRHGHWRRCAGQHLTFLHRGVPGGRACAADAVLPQGRDRA